MAGRGGGESSWRSAKLSPATASDAAAAARWPRVGGDGGAVDAFICGRKCAVGAVASKCGASCGRGASASPGHACGESAVDGGVHRLRAMSIMSSSE
jgi:hypothetical protein